MSAAIQSPCIQICELNSNGVCSGCFRTTDEIGRWTIFSDDERDKVMQSLAKREKDFLATCFD